MSLESPQNSGFPDPPFSLESATVSSFSARLSVRVTSVLSALSIGLSMMPGVGLAEEVEDPFETNDSSDSRYFRFMLVLHLSIEESGVGAVVLCDDLALGPWGKALDAKNFLTFQVHKVDFPKSEQVSFYVRVVDGRYYFAEKPESLFQDKAKYDKDPSVMNEAVLLQQLTREG